MIMFSVVRRPILDIAALKWEMRQKMDFQDGVFRSPLEFDLIMRRAIQFFISSIISLHVS